MNKILIVCIGNICRSPAGEAFFRDAFEKKQLPCVVASAGIHAMVDSPADNHVQTILKEKYGLDIAAHRAQQLTDKLLKESDLVLVMDEEQKHFISLHFPFASGKVQRLGQWKKTNISDPYRQSKEIFEDRITTIQACVQSWIDRFW